ncbi:cyclin-dependent kinase inhibitor far1 [Mortierella sp. GBA30]|nr:cyclin-dependent kinase inhibitor far1 [Mortierella sp. GBA30]
MSDEEISAFEKDVVLKMYPSTYRFTKSLAEQLMQSRRKSLNLPMIIVRMTVVGGCLTEPVPGWAECLTGANVVMVFCATGAIQEWAGDEVGSSCYNPLSIGFLFSYWECYWQQQTKLRDRVTDDIRIDFYQLPDFPHRYQQRFAKELELARKSKEGAERYGKTLRKVKSVTKLLTPFLCYEWFYDATNALWLDSVAPEELHSGLAARIHCTKYLHNYCLGVHEYIWREQVDRTKEINFRLRVFMRSSLKARARSI